MVMWAASRFPFYGDVGAGGTVKRKINHDLPKLGFPVVIWCLILNDKFGKNTLPRILFDTTSFKTGI